MGDCLIHSICPMYRRGRLFDPFNLPNVQTGWARLLYKVFGCMGRWLCLSTRWGSTSIQGVLYGPP